MTTKDLQDSMAEHYQIISSQEENNEDTEDKVVLVYFYGECNNCKCHRYKAKDFPHKKQLGCNKNENNKKNRGNCNNCGKYGHKASDCWELPKQPRKGQMVGKGVLKT